MTQLIELAAELERDRSRLAEELAEIELLMRQASSEAERHEVRRVQAEQRMSALDNEPGSDSTVLGEARAQLLSQTRRQTMMQGQLEVLQGKQRALQRYHERLEQLLPALGAAAAASPAVDGQADGAAALSVDRVAVDDSPDPDRLSLAAADETGTGSATDTLRAPVATARDVMAAQEEMRREIARQMHDGPAQSIANIALQAQIVQRLAARDPRQAESELRELTGMVQRALEATKTFIFDVRPMVLDDLGLVPTLRRAAGERSRRSGQPVVFESAGADARLGSELESALFRIVDDAVQGMLDAHATEVLVRLDWQESAVGATVRGRSPTGLQSADDAAREAVAAARRDKEMPAALASMIHEQRSIRGRGLAEKSWEEIRDRAEPVEIEVSLADEGWLLRAQLEYRR